MRRYNILIACAKNHLDRNANGEKHAMQKQTNAKGIQYNEKIDQEDNQSINRLLLILSGLIADLQLII